MKIVLVLAVVVATWLAGPVSALAQERPPEVRAFQAVQSTDFQVLPDGGAIIAGWTYSARRDPERDYAYWLLRLDKAGKVLWERRYGAEPWIVDARVAALTGGGFMLAGRKAPEDDIAGAWPQWLMRTDGAGEVLWEKTFADKSFSWSGPWAGLMAPAADGGVIVIGESKIGARRRVVIRGIDAAGGISWQREFGPTDDAYPVAIEADPKGGLVVVGRRYGDGNRNRAWAARLDGEGRPVWHAVFAVEPGVSVSRIAALADGGVVVAGVRWPRGKRAESNIWVARIGPGGAVRWRRGFGGRKSERVYGLAALAGGGIAIAGTTTSLGAGKRDMWTLRLTGQGRLDWQRTFGTRSAEYVAGVRALPGGGLAVLGTTYCEANVVWFLKYPARLPRKPAPAPPGIGVARHCVQWTYERAPRYRLTFRKADNMGGQPRVIGQAPDKLTRLELVGPETNLVAATFSLPIEPSHPDAVLHFGAFLLAATPYWPDKWEWLRSVLPNLTAGNRVQHDLEHRRITLSFDPNRHVTRISVRSTSPK